jgi:hypothetical protein
MASLSNGGEASAVEALANVEDEAKAETDTLDAMSNVRH